MGVDFLGNIIHGFAVDTMAAACARLDFIIQRLAGDLTEVVGIFNIAIYELLIAGKHIDVAGGMDFVVVDVS